MSGIYIPNVEIPRCCIDCHYHKSLIDKCILAHRDQSDLWIRPDWCPLVPVPDHGRVIDVDVILHDLSPTEEDANDGAKLLLAVFCQVLNSAPTILPADKERDA